MPGPSSPRAHPTLHAMTSMYHANITLNISEDDNIGQCRMRLGAWGDMHISTSILTACSRSRAESALPDHGHATGIQCRHTLCVLCAVSAKPPPLGALSGIHAAVRLIVPYKRWSTNWARPSHEPCKSASIVRSQIAELIYRSIVRQCDA